ncbi:TM87B protein, partial [Atractosteus spatula]|nr:TM87B protein [Atractosteus spatula]
MAAAVRWVIQSSPWKTRLWFALFARMLLWATDRGAEATPEPGQWTFTIDNTSRPLLLQKSLFENTDIYLKVKSFHCPEVTRLTIKWYLKYYPCHNEFNNIDEMYDKTYLSRGESLDPNPFGAGEYINHTYHNVVCHNELQVFPVLNKSNSLPRSILPPSAPAEKVDISQPWSSTTPVLCHAHVCILITDLVVTKRGCCFFCADIGSCNPNSLFYMVMCIIYILYGVLWFLWSACYWKDLLRIQFWIAAVIFLGMLEKAVFCAEYQNTNFVGSASQGLLIFAELISALKRTLARLLVIIVSLGYGIVKPRLGTVMHRVVGLGVLYFIFAAVEGVLRITGGRDNAPALISEIVLNMFNTGFVWFISFSKFFSLTIFHIFVTLAQTLKTLKLRRNPVKLSLYRHFTNTLIFAIIASIIFMIWTTKKFRLADCQSDWRELWVDDAFWRFLFSIMLLVIMFLWRPSAINQRYAFTPLMDDSDDEEIEEFLLS